MFILLDNIFIALIAALLGFTGMLMILFGTIDVINGILISILCLCYISFAGTYRIMLAKGKYPRYQVISMKIVLILSCLAYLILATYYMQNDIPLKEGSGSQ